MDTDFKWADRAVFSALRHQPFASAEGSAAICPGQSRELSQGWIDAGRRRSRIVADDGFDLREEVEAVRALFATPAAVLETAPSKRVVESIVAIHPYGAGIVGRGGDLVPCIDILRPYTGRQAERRVIAFSDDIRQVVEGDAQITGPKISSRAMRIRL